MKKMLMFLLALCVVTIPAYALVPANMNTYDSMVQTEGVNNITGDQAEMLRDLGLFVGTDKGFELDRGLTRAEAGALMVRALGKETEALSQTNKHPFTDVPVWADKYVGWLYKNKITNGISAKQYGSGQSVTYWQFATFLSRACAGNDNFIENGVGKASEEESCNGGANFQANGFKRAEAVGLLTRFLGCYYNVNPDEYLTVAQHLVREGVFTAKQLFEAGVNIYPIYYYYFNDDDTLTSTILMVCMKTSALNGIGGSTAFPQTELPHFYAWKYNSDSTVLYKMDCLTLADTELARFDAVKTDSPGYIDYFATVGGKDYLGVKINDKAILAEVDGNTVKTIAEGKEFGFRYLKYITPSIWKDNEFVICLDDTAYVVTKDGIGGHKVEAGAEIVAVQEDVAVMYREENSEAVIKGVSLADWSVTDTYRVTFPSAYYFQMIRQNEKGIYGEAGLFIVREGRLIRATERPVLDVSGVRYGAAGTPVILTSSTGSYYGDTIIVLNDPYYMGTDGWTEGISLSNDPPHGIAITRIEGRDSAVFFYSESPVGMGNYDVFTYGIWYNSEEGHAAIYVESFTAGRPEISFAEHNAEWYIKQEQERLNALGFKPW